MQVIDYFSEIQSLIKSSIFVESADVEYEVKSRGLGIVHGMIGMVDGSALQFMELVNTRRDKMIRLKYRFHFMNTKAKWFSGMITPLIIRKSLLIHTTNM